MIAFCGLAPALPSMPSCCICCNKPCCTFRGGGDVAVMQTHPRFCQTLVLVPPYHQVQKLGQVRLPDAVLGAGGVRHSVLVQHE